MITVEKNEFLNAIKAVKTSCAKINNLQPILNTIHIKTQNGGLELTATDLIVSARTIIEASVTEENDFCVNAEKLENIVNALDGLVSIDCLDAKAIISSGKTKFEVLIVSAQDFPEVAFNLSDDKVVLTKDDFIKGVNKTSIATVPEAQNLLSGICFTFNGENGYEMAATDGNRLSVIKFDRNQEGKTGQYIIPHNILNNILKYIGEEIEVCFTNNKVYFKTANFLYSTTLFNGTFPEYGKLIPKSFEQVVTINRNELLSALEKVAIMSDSKTNITVFDFKGNELYLTTSCDVGKAEDTISVDFNGEIKIAFNFKYILEGIKAMQSDKVLFEMNGATSACLIMGDFAYIVMPIMQRG